MCGPQETSRVENYALLDRMHLNPLLSIQEAERVHFFMKMKSRIRNPMSQLKPAVPSLQIIYLSGFSRRTIVAGLRI